jgi:hypothetical protein
VTETAPSERGAASQSSSRELAKTGRACLLVATVAALAGVLGSLGAAMLAAGYALVGAVLLWYARPNGPTAGASGRFPIRAVSIGLTVLAAATALVIIEQL